MTASGGSGEAGAVALGAQGPEELSPFARAAIGRLGLAPHPEGGWYRRTWQSALPWGAPGAQFPTTAPDAADMGERSTGARPLASLIYFLLPAGDASAWHKVDADELWLWHGPGAVTLQLGGTGESPVPRERVELGPDAGGVPVGQLVVPAGTWQRTLPVDADVLCSCVVSPGFVYQGFSLAG